MLGVLNVLSVLHVLNVLNIPKDASLALCKGSEVGAGCLDCSICVALKETSKPSMTPFL